MCRFTLSTFSHHSRQHTSQCQSTQCSTSFIRWFSRSFKWDTSATGCEDGSDYPFCQLHSITLTPLQHSFRPNLQPRSSWCTLQTPLSKISRWGVQLLGELVLLCVYSLAAYRTPCYPLSFCNLSRDSTSSRPFFRIRCQQGFPTMSHYCNHSWSTHLSTGGEVAVGGVRTSLRYPPRPFMVF